MSTRALFLKSDARKIDGSAGGGFDEYKISNYIERKAAIDGFGVGTRMGVSADAPYTDMACKMVRYGRSPVMKLSAGKRSLPGPRQVFRTVENGKMIKDVVAGRKQGRPKGVIL